MYDAWIIIDAVIVIVSFFLWVLDLNVKRNVCVKFKIWIHIMVVVLIVMLLLLLIINSTAAITIVLILLLIVINTVLKICCNIAVTI